MTTEYIVKNDRRYKLMSRRHFFRPWMTRITLEIVEGPPLSAEETDVIIQRLKDECGIEKVKLS